MGRYRSRPQEVEAVVWSGHNIDEVLKFAPDKVYVLEEARELHLLAGKDGVQDWVPVPLGHWLVCQPGDRSDVWPVDPTYFASKYEPVI